MGFMRKSRLSHSKQDRLTEHFVAGTTARPAGFVAFIAIMERKIVPDSIVYSDCWRGYNVLDVSDFKHFRINHSELFADKLNHVNGIENFWNQAKRYLRKFNGAPKAHFGLFLKACKWRFNNSDPPNHLTQIRQWVKRYLIVII